MRDLRTARFVGPALVVVSGVVYWLSARQFEAGHPDFFLLAEAFLEGRTWLEVRTGPWDVILVGDRIYVPFGPFPAIAFMPLVALVGVRTAEMLEPLINAGLAAGAVGLCWILMGRLAVERWQDRLAMCLLLGFSTPILWITTRGGVWHTGQLFATILTLGCLIELWGRQRPVLIGLMAGAAFLSRAPLAFAIPFYLLMLEPRAVDAAGSRITTAIRAIPVRQWALLGGAAGVSVLFFFWYNVARFGSILESGYGLAVLPEFLQRQRELGLFSLAHVRMNIDYFLLRTPRFIPEAPFLRPDGLGMSVFITSPGLLLATRADWRMRRGWWLLGAAALVLVPTLLYYGGGWLQYGYRYFLDSMPFVIALCGLAAARTGRIGLAWIAMIAAGVVVNALGVYWAYNI
jgi:hypothetical protein